MSTISTVNIATLEPQSVVITMSVAHFKLFTEAITQVQTADVAKVIEPRDQELISDMLIDFQDIAENL